MAVDEYELTNEEVRNKIYEYWVDEDFEWERKADMRHWRFASSDIRQLYKLILHANREVRSEFATLFYGRWRFSGSFLSGTQ